jgi:hypothetical protein
MTEFSSSNTATPDRPTDADGGVPSSADPWAELVTTASCREELLADLHRIRNQLESGFTERLLDARALTGKAGDSASAATLRERRLAMASLGRLERILAHATLVDEAAWSASTGARQGPARVRARPGRA